VAENLSIKAFAAYDDIDNGKNTHTRTALNKALPRSRCVDEGEDWKKKKKKI
jgi:hypothetical protein